VRQQAELTEVGMNLFSIFASIWCWTLVLFPAAQIGKDTTSADLIQKLREIEKMLRAAWGADFHSTHQKYMQGSSPTVVLILRQEMIRIVATPLDGRQREGATPHGLTITGDTNYLKIVAVYDDLAPIFVARTINHEIGHLQLMDKGLSRSHEEARVRKIVDTGFFEKVLGLEWLETTIAALQKKVRPVERNGRLYQGYTKEAVDVFYQQLEKSQIKVEKNPIHDGIVENLVFILTNSEEHLATVLDADDQADLNKTAK
jgi:hypothetical protein